MPEQEFLPSRPPVRFQRPGPGDRGPDGPAGDQEEDPPPWANLPPVRPARPAGPGGRQPPSGAAGPHQQEQLPQWAGPDAAAEDETLRDQPHAPGGPAGRPAARGRARRAAARRRRRWLIMAVGLVVLAGGVTAAVVAPGGPAPAPVVPGGLITTFQPGELQTVPSACGTVPAVTVQQYLPGRAKQAAPLPVGGTAESACDWTIDQAPVYRLLELNLLAYAPSGLASGDGSATYAAIDAYARSRQDLRDPPRHSADPPAALTTLNGLGDEAFSATQVFRRGGAVTDVVTVVVRYHNVIVTATLNGLEHSNRGTYGPVSVSQLSAAALAFAQAAEATLH